MDAVLNLLSSAAWGLSLYFIFVWLLGFWGNGKHQNDIYSAPAAPVSSYTETITNAVIEMYRKGEPLEDIARFAGTSVASVRSKLVYENVYQKYRIERLRAIERGPLNNRSADLSFNGGRATPMTVSIGDDCYTKLVEFLAQHYVRVSHVHTEGDYRTIGGVIEVWLYGQEQPVSLDFFGERLETAKPPSVPLTFHAEIYGGNTGPIGSLVATG